MSVKKETPSSPVAPARSAVLHHRHEHQSGRKIDHSPPDWFKQAIKLEPEDRFIKVDGCRIHYLLWGHRNKPGLLFIHGGFAHAHWWDFIAPLFAEDYFVAAIDLSG